MDPLPGTVQALSSYNHFYQMFLDVSEVTNKMYWTLSSLFLCFMLNIYVTPPRFSDDYCKNLFQWYSYSSPQKPYRKPPKSFRWSNSIGGIQLHQVIKNVWKFNSTPFSGFRGVAIIVQLYLWDNNWLNRQCDCVNKEQIKLRYR